jgi:hypothetical protein
MVDIRTGHTHRPSCKNVDSGPLGTYRYSKRTVDSGDHRKSKWRNKRKSANSHSFVSILFDR